MFQSGVMNFHRPIEAPSKVIALRREADYYAYGGTIMLSVTVGNARNKLERPKTIT